MAKKHDYVANAPARSLKARSTNAIAVLVQGGLSPIFLGRYGDKAEGALSSQRLAAMGTPIVFCTTSDFSGSRSPRSSVSIDDRAASAAISTL